MKRIPERDQGLTLTRLRKDVELWNSDVALKSVLTWCNL